MKKSPLENHKPKGEEVANAREMEIDHKGNVTAHFKRVQNCGCVAHWLPQILTRTRRRRVAWNMRRTMRGTHPRSPSPGTGVPTARSAPGAGCPRASSLDAGRCSGRALVGQVRASQLRLVVRASPRSPVMEAPRSSCASEEHPVTASGLPRSTLPRGGFGRGDTRRARAAAPAVRAGSPAARVLAGRRKAAFRSRTMCS